MAINIGPDLDMATLSGPDADPNYSFMKEPDAVNFTLSDQYINHGQYMPQPIKNNIKLIQEYFKNPTPILKEFIGDLKYTGEADGIINDELKSIIKTLESAIAKDLKTADIFGMILETDPEDIEEALSYIIKQDLHKKVAKFNRDQRLFSLASILEK